MSDHDRPLSKAGRADAISVSNKLQQMGWIPELILCRCVPICVREYAWIILALQYEYGAHKLWKLKDAIWLHVKHCVCYLTEWVLHLFFLFHYIFASGFRFSVFSFLNMLFWCSVSYLDHDCYNAASTLVVSLVSPFFPEGWGRSCIFLHIDWCSYVWICNASSNGLLHQFPFGTNMFKQNEPARLFYYSYHLVFPLMCHFFHGAGLIYCCSYTISFLC